MTPQAFSLGGEGGPAGPDEERIGRSSPINGRQRQSCPSSVRLATSFPRGGKPFFVPWQTHEKTGRIAGMGRHEKRQHAAGIFPPYDAGQQNQPDDFDDAEPVQQGLRTDLVHFSQTLCHFFGLYCENGGGIITVEYENHRPKADMFKGENILWQIVLF